METFGTDTKIGDNPDSFLGFSIFAVDISLC